ncbi:MAG TPA: agmatinase [Dehalococcoidia bacterium]|nr:agmatinase [Dehalococcoidia bacterium]HIM91458.1 agmatinase [Dehalococcoidia bacterium]
MHELRGGQSGLGPFQWDTFLDTPPDEARYEDAGFVVLSIPFDGTTSFRSGTRDGPSAIIAASGQLEDYDIELGVDISLAGIHTVPELVPNLSSMDALFGQVDRLTTQVISDGKIPALLGGEHTVSIGAVTALARRYPDIAVLYLDAHGDLRDEYMGTRWGHASVARRLMEICPVTHAGVRSLSAEEHRFIADESLNVNLWPPNSSMEEYARAIIDDLPSTIYVSIDLDVLDPSIMAAVGTPEPDGMLWQDLAHVLRLVCEAKRVVGFDLVELAPAEGPEACAYTAAKLTYKLMGYISTLMPRLGAC